MDCAEAIPLDIDHTVASEQTQLNTTVIEKKIEISYLKIIYTRVKEIKCCGTMRRYGFWSYGLSFTCVFLFDDFIDIS